jgi:hypothetical protein
MLGWSQIGRDIFLICCSEEGVGEGTAAWMFILSHKTSGDSEAADWGQAQSLECEEHMGLSHSLETGLCSFEHLLTVGSRRGDLSALSLSLGGTHFQQKILGDTFLGLVLHTRYWCEASKHFLSWLRLRHRPLYCVDAHGCGSHFARENSCGLM